MPFCIKRLDCKSFVTDARCCSGDGEYCCFTPYEATDQRGLLSGAVSDYKSAPWDKYESDLKEEHGPWANYAAWLKWATGEKFDWLENIDPVDQPTIYGIMDELARL